MLEPDVDNAALDDCNMSIYHIACCLNVDVIQVLRACNKAGFDAKRLPAKLV